MQCSLRWDWCDACAPAAADARDDKGYQIDSKSFSKFDEVFSFLSRIPFVSPSTTIPPKSALVSSQLVSLVQGGQVLSFYIGIVAPYSSSISARILKLTKEESVVMINDLPWLRNPFNSVHAIALANLAELASGLGVMTAMQHAKGVRGIITRSAPSSVSRACPPARSRSDQ